MVRLARFFKSTLTISAAAAAIFLSPITAMGQRGALDLEILSKDDVGAIFAMTRAEWTENVRRAVMAGAASATGSPESGLAMVTNTGAGELFVRPNYNDQGRPDFIHVTVGYRSPTVLTDAVLNGAIKLVEQQMEPEYEVTGHAERLKGGVAVHLVITEREPP
jgi:hypothetical protein